MSEAIDRLYTLPLDRFTTARNELSKELAAAGESEAAAEVKKLKKPNLAAWAVNQVVHTDGVDELFAVTDELRRAQRKVMSGGRAGDLREVTDRRNRIVADLTKRARAILADAGHAASATTLAAVSDSFVAVASDEEGAELLKAGRLTRELKPQAVVDVGGLHLVEPEAEEPEEPEEPEERERPVDREALAEARAALSRAREAEKVSRRTAWDAEREAERLAQLAKEAEQKAKAAREEAEFAARAAEARRSEHAEAERDIAEASAEVDRLSG